MRNYQRPPRQCLDCHTLIATGQPRCPNCTTRHQTPRNRRKQNLYGNPIYKTARAQLLANATHCWICGQPPTPNDPLTADHIIPLARQHGPANHTDLRAAHRSCNARRKHTPHSG